MRLGTGEFYAVVEEFPEVREALVVHLEDPEGGAGELLLFVVPTENEGVDDALRERIAGALRRQLSPRHVPDGIIAVEDLPRTLTGKKLEVPVKRILRGEPPDRLAARDSLANPEALDAFVELAAARRHAGAIPPRM